MGLTYGSLFTGIGGMDLGLDRAGFECKWQVENNPMCRQILADNWPEVPKGWDVREFIHQEVSAVDLICGGDPCPVRSRAKGSLRSKHPDLSGYFLALVGRLRPRWVVRENVPAPDVQHFAACLEALGYGATIVELDGADFTSQSRWREFCVGSPSADTANFRRAVSSTIQHPEARGTHMQEEASVPCLTAHPNRLGQDAYCYEEGRGLRLLDCEEAEVFMGFPRGWTRGFSRTRRRIMLGNAVIPGKAEYIGRLIVESKGVPCESS